MCALLARESRDSLNGATSIHPKDPALAELWGGGRNSASGQHVTTTTAMRVSAVFACITIHAQTMAMLPKHVKALRPDGGMDLLPGHRLYRQIHDQPNRWQSSFEFFEYMVGCRWTRGNAYAYINFNPGRQTNELVPLDPDRVWPFVITPSGVTYYLYDNSPPPPAGSALWYQYFPLNAETVIMSAKDVLHIRGYSTNGIIGMSPITKAAREAIGLAMATEEHGGRLFSNGARPSLVVKYPGKISDQAFDQMKKAFQEQMVGNSNSGKPFFAEDGMDIQPLSLSSQDAQFLETRKFQIEEIARIFNMPLIMIEAGDKAATFASAEQFFLSFKAQTMQPEVVRFEQAMQRSLLYPSETGKIILQFDMDSMMRADAVARATYLQKRFQTSSITPDGIMVYENENPSGTEGGKKYYIMSNMVPLDMAGQNIKPAQSATEANA
jgi:HK97 family phage portal protein